MSRRPFSIARGWLTRVLTVSLVLQPWSALTAEPLLQPAPARKAVPATRTADIELRDRGVLVGQVVNAAGLGVAKVKVQLSNGNGEWQATTDDRGWFQVNDLHGGVYQFQAHGESQVVRAWKLGTAPPHASRGVLVTPADDVFRGQRVLSPNVNQFFRVAKRRFANPVVVAGVVATAVAIPVALHNADDDDPPATP